MQLQRRLSTADPLTGTFNRRFFDDYLQNELARVSRYGSAQRARERVEEIREAIAREPLLLQLKDAVGDNVYVTVSIGVASWPADGRTAAALLAEADRRLVVAKNAGRNRVVGAADGRAVVQRS